MKMISMKRLVFTLPVVFTCVFLAPVTHAELKQPTLSAQQETVLKTATSYMVSTYACRNVGDTGLGPYKNAKQRTSDTLSVMLKSPEQASKITAVLDNKIENTDPGEQLQRQFDSVHATDAVKMNACKQLMAGNKDRFELSVNQLTKSSED